MGVTVNFGSDGYATLEVTEESPFEGGDGAVASPRDLFESMKGATGRHLENLSKEQTLNSLANEHNSLVDELRQNPSSTELQGKVQRSQIFVEHVINAPTPTRGVGGILEDALAAETSSRGYKTLEQHLETGGLSETEKSIVTRAVVEYLAKHLLKVNPINVELALTNLDTAEVDKIRSAIDDQCFLYDTSVQMWPLDPSIKPRPDGSYNEELVLSKVWYKQQNQMQVNDWVVSHDKLGRMQPGRVSRTMTNTATHILDFWGTGVTPGHAYYCADGPFKDGYAPIMDVLRTDTALKRSDGTTFRAATNCDVGSIGDRVIHVEASAQNPDGTWTPKKRGQIRFGTRISTPDGKKSVSVMEIAERQGWSLSDDGYMIGKIEGHDGTAQEGKFPFPYTYGTELPKPETYILTRSQVTLEEIYLANEWEKIGTRMPAPNSLAGFNPNSTMKRSKPKPNIPPAFANRPDVPTVESRAQHPAHPSHSPSMNRKQRKTMEAKQRKAAKMRKRAAG